MWNRNDAPLIIYFLLIGTVIAIGIICETILKLNGMSLLR